MARLPQIFEIFDEANTLKDPKLVADLFLKHNSGTLQMILKQNFDPSIKYLLPAGAPPFKAQNIPVGLTEQTLYSESRRLAYLWITLPQNQSRENMIKRETLFIGMLETLHQGDAQVILAVKDKELHKVFPGVTEAAVRLAYPNLLPPPVAEPEPEKVKEKKPRKPRTPKAKNSGKVSPKAHGKPKDPQQLP